MKALLAIITLGLYAGPLKADDERIFLNVRINGEHVRLAVDTGAGTWLALFSNTAERLKLKVTPPATDEPIAPGQIRLGQTEPQRVEFESTNFQIALDVLDMPAYMKPTEDGILGWPALRANVFYLDCAAHTVKAFTNTSEDFTSWTGYRIHTNSDVLDLELSGENRSTGIVALDTGSTHGVELNPKEWQDWRAAHIFRPMTLESYYTPNPGIVVAEEGWADRISLGSLLLTEVPVMQANSTDVTLGSSQHFQFVATLGFAALKRLDILVDGQQGVIWLRPKRTPSTPYWHNRLGAAFAPKTLQSDDLIAHVINDSPAFEAGVRDGDILLKVDGRDFTNWRDPNAKGEHPFSDLPSGTKVHLVLKRNGKIFKAVATLRNILPPDSQRD